MKPLSHRHTAAATCCAALLSACGGGSDSTPAAVIIPPATVSQSVSVVDGPIIGATVCLDKNANGACDSDETKGVTGADGSVTLAVPVADVGKYAVLAVVGLDAVDTVNGAVTTAFTMKAPADKPGVVSPLTTLVAAQAAATGSSSLDAEKALQDSLNLSASLFEDFSKKPDNTASQLAASVARLLVLTVQQQTRDTADAKASDGTALSKTDITQAINTSLLAALPAVAAALADPAVAGASGAAKEAAIKAAATQVAGDLGLTAVNLGAVVAAAKLPGTPDGTAAPAAGATLRWFSFTDAGNYAYRSFKSTAAQNTVVNGKRQFTEYREQKATNTAGTVTQYLQWGAGLNNQQRNLVYWTGTEWFDCPNDFVHEATPWDASGKSDSLYCKANKTSNKRSERDIAGVKMVDLVKEIRAYPLFDNAGRFSAWGPDPVTHASALAATFPTGAKLYYYTGNDAGTTEQYFTTASDVAVAYNAAVSGGVKAECDKVTATNGALFQVSAATLDAVIGAAKGLPCIYTVGNNTGETRNEGWGTSTINVGDVADPYANATGFYKVGLKDLRASFAAGNVANYWLCLRRASDNSARNCNAVGSGSYSIDTVGDARVLRLAGLPAIAGNLSYNRLMVERGGKVYYGSRNKPQVTNQLRLNLAASDALFTALGVPTPQAAAALTPDSLLARYVTGAGTLSRNALAFMENDPAGLVGAWAPSATDPFVQTFFFFSNGQYVMVDPLGDVTTSTHASCGGAGVELANYSAVTANSVIAFTLGTVLKDTNGCAGINDATNPVANRQLSSTLSSDGKSFTLTTGETFVRLSK